MKFSTADLCDTHSEKVQLIRPGFRHFGGTREFSGTIRTVSCFEDNSLVRKMLEADVKASVLVVDGRASMRCALLGDRLATLATANGWEGLIVNGCVRDSATLRTLQLGVMALATQSRKSHKIHAGAVDVPVFFAGVSFLPGGFVYADADGVLVAVEKLESRT